MAQGQKRTPQEIADVLTTYAITDSLSETSRRTGVPVTTCKDIVDKHRGTEAFEKLRNEKREQFSERANRIVFKGLTLLERRYDKALDKEDELDLLLDTVFDSEDLSDKNKQDIAKKLSKLELNTLSELTTSMGTLFDKMRLANGESTENSSQTITVTMSKELEELSK